MNVLNFLFQSYLFSTITQLHRLCERAREINNLLYVRFSLDFQSPPHLQCYVLFRVTLPLPLTLLQAAGVTHGKSGFQETTETSVETLPCMV